MKHTIINLNIIDGSGINLIKEIQFEQENEISINSSKDGKLILLSITTPHQNVSYPGMVYVLSKVDDYYIIDGVLDPCDECTSRFFGINTAIYESEDGYIIAVADTEYKGSDGVSQVGGVFIFKYIPTKKWTCIKTITKLDGNKEYNYKNLGSCLAFTETGSLILTGDINGNSEVFLYETEDFKQFKEYRIAKDVEFKVFGSIKIVNDVLYLNTRRKNNEKFVSEIYYCDINTYTPKLEKLIGFMYDDRYVGIVDFYRYNDKLLVVTLNTSGSSTPCLMFDLYTIESNRAYSRDNAILNFKPSVCASIYSRLCLGFKESDLYISYLSNTSKSKYSSTITKYDISENLRNINGGTFEEIHKNNSAVDTKDERLLFYIKMKDLLSVSDDNIFFLDRENDKNDKCVYRLKSIN